MSEQIQPATPEEILIAGIPLFNLHESERNARTVKQPVDELAASIRAHGLLKNLVVIPRANGDGYEVIAGDRRRRALLANEESGWPPPPLIPCRVLHPDASPEEISLAENVGHEPMHPVDEFVAYSRLVKDEGLGIDDLVTRFGKTKLYIAQRLKLASVSPKILELFKADDISMAQVMALAITEDHKAQEKVWEAAARTEWMQRPDNLRSELMEKELEVGEDCVATYLGVKDYEAGGGQARLDLFSDMAWLPDAKLARALAKEKLDKHAKRIRKEGWSWVEVRLEFPYEQREKFATPYGWYGDGPSKWPAEAKATGGAVVTLDGAGAVDVRRGLVRKSDLQQTAKASGSASVKRAAEKVKPAKKSGQLSWAQTQLLQAERDAVLREEIAGNTRIALAALAARLADDLKIVKGTGLDEVIRVSRGHLSSDRVPLVAKPVQEKHDASKRLREKVAAWKTRVPKGSSTLEYLLTQPEATTHELLTLCAAMALHAMPWHEGMQDAGAKLAQIAGVDMASHWTPTAEWLERQPTSYITEAVQQARGKAALLELRKAKGKKAVAKKAAELLAPVPGRAAWLPAPLRAPAVKARPKKTKTTGKTAAAGD